ncbi:hypothetical protein GGR09_000659 [Bartonella heixiaziensis]
MRKVQACFIKCAGTYNLQCVLPLGDGVLRGGDGEKFARGVILHSNVLKFEEEVRGTYISVYDKKMRKKEWAYKLCGG